MITNNKLMDEAAMKVIIDRLVDPWHKTFARDVVELYLKHANKHPDHIGDVTDMIETGTVALTENAALRSANGLAREIGLNPAPERSIKHLDNSTKTPD